MMRRLTRLISINISVRLPANNPNARINALQYTPGSLFQKRTSVGVVWVIAHVGLKRKL